MEFPTQLRIHAVPVWVQFACVAAGVSLVDAIAGRLLHAHPDPSVVLLASGAFLVVRQLVAHRRPDVGAVWGVVFAAAYLGCFRLAAEVLVGWNHSLPWVLTSSLVQSALLAGLIGGVLGSGPAVGAAKPKGGSSVPVS